MQKAYFLITLYFIFYIIYIIFFQFFIVVHLTTLSVAQTTLRRIIGWLMNDELEGYGRKRSWLKVLPLYLLGGIEENHLNLSQDCRTPGQNFNPGLPNTKQEC
jgi:hypothetical protein